MLNTIKTSACVLSLCILLLSCSKKASDYSCLISSYKKIHCFTLSSSKTTLLERKKGLEKISHLQNEYKQALKFLKQEEKEKLNDMLSEAIREIAKGNCK